MRTRDLPWVKDLLKGQPKAIQAIVLKKLSAARLNVLANACPRYDFVNPPQEVLWNAFIFAETPEGQGFWQDIAEGDFSTIEALIRLEKPAPVKIVLPEIVLPDVAPEKAAWIDSKLHKHVVGTYGDMAEEILHNLLLNDTLVDWGAEDIDQAFSWDDSVQEGTYWVRIWLNSPDYAKCQGYNLLGTVVYKSATKGVDCPIVRLKIRRELWRVKEGSVENGFKYNQPFLQSFSWMDSPQGGEFWGFIFEKNYSLI